MIGCIGINSLYRRSLLKEYEKNTAISITTPIQLAMRLAIRPSPCTKYVFVIVRIVTSCIIVMGLLRVPWLYVWYPQKLPSLAISRSGVMQGFGIVVLISFVLECTMSIFKVMNVLPCFSFLFENTQNIPLIDGEFCTQCVLRQWFHH